MLLISDIYSRYVKSKRPTISPNFNFLGQLLEYEKQLRNERILEPKPESRPAPPVCSKKRVCRTDMRKLALSLDLDSESTENPKDLLPPKKEDQSPTTALAKLSFDVPKCETNDPPLADFRQFRSKSCYGDWLRAHDESASEKKGREGNVSSKILSPVKEIKCEGLISEISTGNNEINTRSKGVVRQRTSSSQYSREEKRTNMLQKYSNKYETHYSNVNRASFSLMTLSHMSSSSNSKFQDSTSEISENISQNKKTRSSFSSLHSLKDKLYLNEKNEIKSNFYSPQLNEKFARRSSLVRSNENLPGPEDLELKFVSKEDSLFHNKMQFAQHSLSVNSDLHKLSDSFEASGLGRGNSDFNQRGARNFNLMINCENMENKNIFTKTEAGSNQLASEQAYFPSTFSEDKNWIQNSDSSGSVTEDPLLESDTETKGEIINNNAGTN